MSKNQYSWMEVQAIIAMQALVAEGLDDTDPPEMALLIGLAGVLRHHQHQAANEAANLRLFLTLIYVWSCAKYRAHLLVKHRKSVNFVQNETLAFSTPDYATTLALQGLREIIGQFLGTYDLCQMNSSRTLNTRWQ